jgi:hypothetical protein
VGEVDYGLAGHAVGRFVGGVSEAVHEIQSAVYQAVSMVSLERVRELRVEGKTCGEIGEAMRREIGAAWPRAYGRWVGYWFCDASSRVHRERLEDPPWQLNGVPD